MAGHHTGSKQRLLLTQGQDLVWGKPDCGFQGVTELTECERAKDTWLQDLQEEFRYSQLSSNSHAFLHGLPTTVPGSWLRGEPSCGNVVCQSLVKRGATPSKILKEECGKCREERRRRRPSVSRALRWRAVCIRHERPQMSHKQSTRRSLCRPRRARAPLCRCARPCVSGCGA